MAAITGLIVAGIVGAVLSAAAGVAGSALNYNAQVQANDLNKQAVEDTNAANLQIARENNAMQMDLAKHGIEYRMQDLDNAGINPILAAGGMSSPSSSLSSARMAAPQVQAPVIDFNGISSAVNALNNTMLTSYLMEGRKEIAAGRNDVLSSLYQRKGAYFNDASTSKALIGNAAKISSSMKESGISDKELKDLVDKIEKKRALFKGYY